MGEVIITKKVLTKRHSETTNQKKVKLETKHDIKHMEPINSLKRKRGNVVRAW